MLPGYLVGENLYIRGKKMKEKLKKKSSLKKKKSYFKKYEDAMCACTFAQSGDYKTVDSILKEKVQQDSFL